MKKIYISIGNHNGSESSTSPLTDSEWNLLRCGRWVEGRVDCVKMWCWWRERAFLLHAHPDCRLWTAPLLGNSIWPPFLRTPPPCSPCLPVIWAQGVSSNGWLSTAGDCRKDPYWVHAQVGERCHVPERQEDRSGGWRGISPILKTEDRGTYWK